MFQKKTTVFMNQKSLVKKFNKLNQKIMTKLVEIPLKIKILLMSLIQILSRNQ